MRRKVSLTLIIGTVLALIFASTLCVNAQESVQIPTLNKISFRNAVIKNGFSTDIYEYDLVLNDPSVTPTLKDYDIQGDANLFVSYNYDDLNRQTGITATLEYPAGSARYRFNYENILSEAHTKVNSNNFLSDITCPYGEIMPEINEKDTKYTLYIPKDLTHLLITPATEDINSYCAPVELTLNEEQIPEILLTCVATDGSKRNYSLEIKRVDKTLAQVKIELEQNSNKSFVDGTFIYQKPEFLITVAAVIAGLIIFALLYKLTARITLNPIDDDEKPFYKPNE